MEERKEEEEVTSCVGRRTLRSLLSVIWWSLSPSLRQCRLVHFCGWWKNLEWTYSRSMDLRWNWKQALFGRFKRCLFPIPPPSKDCSFPLDLGREASV